MSNTLSTRTGKVPIITVTLTMVIIMMWENTDAIMVTSMCGFQQRKPINNWHMMSYTSP